MSNKVYEAYSKSANITFIMEAVYENDKLITEEVKGYYYGKPDPNPEVCEQCYGELKYDFTWIDNMNK